MRSQLHVPAALIVGTRAVGAHWQEAVAVQRGSLEKGSIYPPGDGTLNFRHQPSYYTDGPAWVRVLPTWVLFFAGRNGFLYHSNQPKYSC
jgi:hypothetical protein